MRKENIKDLRPGSKNTTIFTTERATCSLPYVKLKRLVNCCVSYITLKNRNLKDISFIVMYFIN